MILRNKFYIDEQVLDSEKNIFRKECWLLIAHKSELLKNNDFISFNYLGEKIFIKNFNGNIKSFQNVCLHRFNTIHEEDYGNRSTSCSYHNWVYNKEGRIGGLYCRDSFSNTEISDLKLKEYEVDYCGDFYFIKLDEINKVSLMDYLGSVYSKLENLSRHFGYKTIDYTIEHQGNWKLLVENVLECYHCTSVHENSFAKLGYGFIKPEKFDFFQGHSWCEFPKKIGFKENKLINKVLISRTYKCEGYIHFYIYPNAFISSVEGKGFYFGFLFPQNTSKTNLRVRYFSPKLEAQLNESEKNIYDFINQISNDSLDLVLKEDKKMIENIQSNLKNFPSKSPIFGDEEFRINKFYNYFSPILLK
jgi:phenylpropionate dioxygenase-like ring-hydroxylating dioxygenase large terminal subunit